MLLSGSSTSTATDVSSSCPWCPTRLLPHPRTRRSSTLPGVDGAVTEMDSALVSDADKELTASVLIASLRCDWRFRSMASSNVVDADPTSP